MQSFDTCVKVPKYVLLYTGPPLTSTSHLKLIWKHTSLDVVELVIDVWEMVFKVHRTYLVAHICQSSNGCLIGDIFL